MADYPRRMSGNPPKLKTLIFFNIFLQPWVWITLGGEGYPPNNITMMDDGVTPAYNRRKEDGKKIKNSAKKMEEIMQKTYLYRCLGRKKWFWRFGWFALREEYKINKVIRFRSGPIWVRLFWKLWFKLF